MNKLTLTGVAMAALISAPAIAADMPVKYKAPPPPVYTWTGCYAGFAGGWLGGHKEYNRHADGPDLATVVAETTVNDGVHGISGIIGGTLGCNYQVSPVWVIGLEGDFSATRLETSFSQSYASTAGFIARTETVSSNMEWLATVRGRVGALVTPSALLYVTGGVAFAQDKSSFVLSGVTAPVQYAGSDTKTLVGWTVGGGGEWKMDSYFGRGWSMKAEYLYVAFNDHSFSSPLVTANFPGAFWTTNVRRNYDNIFRLGLNYSFGGYGPVVAKY
jgi:outer membrane immunogenic protein